MNDPILILGATSGIGEHAAAEANRRGIPVRAFARSADTIAPAPLLQPVAGDARDPSDVARAVAGSRAVIYALGVKERLSMLLEDETLFSETTRVVIAAMVQSDVRRLVAVTGFGAGRSIEALSRIERLGHWAVFGRPYADKNRQEALIRQSDLDWTIVRPVILTNGRSSRSIKVLRDPATWRNGLVSRADVANHLVDTVVMNLDIQGDVVVTR